MTTNTLNLEQLRSALRDTLAASDRFHALMARERQALANGDLDSLRTVVNDKTTLTKTLLSASQQLLQWCDDQGVEPDYQAFSNWAQPLASEWRDELRRLWRAVRKSLQQNDHDHTINRQLLAALSRRNEAHLSLLQNLVNAATPTYSERGSFASTQPSGWVDSV